MTGLRLRRLRGLGFRGVSCESAASAGPLEDQKPKPQSLLHTTSLKNPTSTWVYLGSLYLQLWGLCPINAGL